MATVAGLIEQTRRLIFSGTREERNKLSGAVSDSATTIPVTYPVASITRGAKLSIDLEDIYVWDVSSLNVTPVDRGQWGSTPAAHSSGAVVNVNPKFSNFEIFTAINNEIASLCTPANGLFYVQTVSIDYNPLIAGYDINYEAIDVIDIAYTIPGSRQDRILSSDWDFVEGDGRGIAGRSIYVRDAWPYRPITVRIKIAYPQLLADMAATTINIPDEVLDILSIGAAWRLTAPMEISRNFTTSQGDTRRAGEVPAGAVLGGSRELGRLRQIRITEEASRLSALYPHRSARYPFRVG